MSRPTLSALLALALHAAALATGGDERSDDLPPAPAFHVESDDAHVRVSWDGHAVDVATVRRPGRYDWHRKVIVQPSHVEVEDTVTNRADDVIGVPLEYAVPGSAADVRLGGQTVGVRTTLYDPWNPTVFVADAGAGAGVVAEDDVLRQQLKLRFDPATARASLATDMLCLAPGDATTLRWSVYPLARARYADFVNTVRRDWGANRTVPGSWAWFTPDHILAMDDAALRAALAHQGTEIASLAGGWVDSRRVSTPTVIGFGSYVADDTFADYRGRIRGAIEKLKRARPGLRALAYFNAQRDSAPDAPTRYRDSLLVTPAGAPERVDWKGRYTPAWSMVPTTSNAFGRRMDEIARAMHSLGADGLYWDEIDETDFRAPRVTTGAWDNRTCMLSADGGVQQKVGLVNLLSAEAKRGYASHGLVLGNGPATTSGWRQSAEIRMIESFHDPSWVTFAHLCTPLGYVGFTDRSWDTVLRTVEAGLLVAGGRLDYDYDVLARMFPFTPRYLDAGTLWGEERVVTTRSGALRWRTSCPAVRAFRYDGDGKEHAATWTTTHDEDVVRVDIDLAPREMAVIECPTPAASR